MAAFQFPDPTVQQTVLNPITGSTYQWKEPPGKWVVTVSVRDVSDIIWEGDLPPNPIGDYKLWYSTDTLELYFHYCDANGVCAWVPTSAPITMLEDLDNTVFELRRDLNATTVSVSENKNQIGRTIYFGDTAPTIYPDVEVTTDIVDTDGETVIGQNTEYFPNELNYKFWFDDSRLELLILFRDADGDDSYMPVSIPLESLPEPGVSVETFTYTTGRLQTAIEENYLELNNRVKKTGGDTMEGQLVINGPRKAGDDPNNPDLVSSVKVLSIDNAQNSSLQLRHSGNAKVYVGSTDVAIASDIKINRAAGSIVKTDDADLMQIVKEEVSYTGNIKNEKNLVTKKYVDDADEGLRQDIIELEEELNAIAPSVEYGTWEWQNPASDNVARPPEPGTFFLIDTTTNPGSPALTDQYAKATRIAIHNEEYVAAGDTDPVNTHTWAFAEPGKLIQLFDAADPDFLLGRITAKNTDTDFVYLDVLLVQTSGVPNDNPDPVTGDYLTRINIFEEPTGGDASDFVKKSGDTMSGPGALKFANNQDTAGWDSNSAKAKITFENKTSDGTTKTSHIFQAGDNNMLVTNAYLMSKQSVYTGNYYYGWDGGSGSSATTYNPRIQITSSAGHLKYGSSKSKLTWNTNGVTVDKGRADNVNGAGFTLKGKIHSSSYTNSGYTDENGNLLQVYHNSGGQDAINYNGKITNDNNITTKKYVDSKMPTYKITKSNGNYYVQ